MSLTDEQIDAMFASAQRAGTDADEWNRVSVRLLIAEVRELRRRALSDEEIRVILDSFAWTPNSPAERVGHRLRAMVKP